MKTKTNYIRWNKEMERKCLGSAWPAHLRNNRSRKNASNTNMEEEKGITNDEIVLEENNCFNSENIENVCVDKDITLDISEDMQENVEESIPENTHNISLKDFMENTIKENEMQKAKIYDNPKKIRWNENMVKRCFGSYLGIQQDTKKDNKKWAKKDSSIPDNNIVKDRNEAMNNEPSEDIISQDSYMLDAQLYNGDFVEEVKKAVKRKKRRNKGSKKKSYSNEGFNDLSYEASLQNLWSGEAGTFVEDNYSDCDKSHDQDDMVNYQKVSWSIISEGEEQKILSESFENIYSDSNQNTDNDINNNTDNESNDNTYNTNNHYNFNTDSDNNETGDIDSIYTTDNDNNDEIAAYDSAECLVSDNIAEDKYYIEEDYFNEENTSNEMENNLNLLTGDIFQIESSGNEGEVYEDYNVFDIEESDLVEALDLEIANETIDSLDWDNNWGEYDLMDTGTQEIETVDSFSDYGNSMAEDIDFNFNYEYEVESQGYTANFEEKGYGQSIECRIVT
ncbi:MAG TPA: hypothetical protein VIO64_06490 [Pseudobacteroides sp.]|uniref:hypothetical protein n=1 Tax=Pseudobacteroides sp. TaxID=1968840 RepID=UPI002F9296D7